MWDNENQTPRKLGGVCACEIPHGVCGDYSESSLPDVRDYGRLQFLLVGRVIAYGNDDWANEVVLAEHRILAIISERGAHGV